MAENSKIEWTGPTINFWWGCDKVSRACKHCYAEEMGRRFGPMHFGQPVLWGQGQPRFQRLEAARAEAIAHNAKAAKKGTRIRAFVNSMSDILDEEVPIEWLAFVLETIILCPNLDFQLLTKRPENWRDRVDAIAMECPNASEDLLDWLEAWTDCVDMPERGAWPENVWMGCTVETQEWADKRIPLLIRIPAKVRFLSCEPLLGPVDLHSPHIKVETWRVGEYFDGPPPLNGIDWVIAGGESGKGAEPMHPDWARSLRDQCAAAQVPFFFKQWGEWSPIFNDDAPFGEFHGGQWIPDCLCEDGQGSMFRVGKKAAGRLLDGIEHNGFPKLEGRAA